MVAAQVVRMNADALEGSGEPPREHFFAPLIPPPEGTINPLTAGWVDAPWSGRPQ